MRRKNTESIDKIIKVYLKSIGADKKLLERQLIQAWPNVVGEGFARQTSELFFSKRVMHVRISSPAVKNELLMLKSTLINRLNLSVKEEYVRDIRFI